MKTLEERLADKCLVIEVKNINSLEHINTLLEVIEKRQKEINLLKKDIKICQKYKKYNTMMKKSKGEIKNVRKRY